MEAIKFKGSNGVLKGYDKIIADLPVKYERWGIVSKWKMNIWERVKILFTGIIWFSVITSLKTHPPIRLSVKKEVSK